MLRTKFSHKLNQGFTLVELLVTLTLIAIVLGIGLPQMGEFVARTAVSGHVNAFVGSLQFARSEAIKRGIPVIMCRAKPEAPSDCDTGTPPIKGWASGWVVMIDPAITGLNASERVLRVQPELTDSKSILPASGTNTTIRFLPVGIAPGATQGFVFNSQLVDAQTSSSLYLHRKYVCIDTLGRPRVLPKELNNCS